jgi:hypothetical protein
MPVDQHVHLMEQLRASGFHAVITVTVNQCRYPPCSSSGTGTGTCIDRRRPVLLAIIYLVLLRH